MWTTKLFVNHPDYHPLSRFYYPRHSQELFVEDVLMSNIPQNTLVGIYIGFALSYTYTPSGRGDPSPLFATLVSRIVTVRLYLCLFPNHDTILMSYVIVRLSNYAINGYRRILCRRTSVLL